MRKLKVYLDTSVISYLEQEDAPEKMDNTLKLWDMFRKNEYKVYLSTVTEKEISACPEPKRSKLLEYMRQIEYHVLSITSEMLSVSQKIIEMGILTSKSYFDCLHIAAALVGGCDCIASWNFKHIVNIKTIHGVRAVANLEGYHTIDIVNPEVLLKGEWSEWKGRN